MPTDPTHPEDAFYALLRTTGVPSSIAHRFTPDMRDNLDAYVRGHAERTVKCWRLDLSRWFAWCDQHEHDPLYPATRAVRDFIRITGDGNHPDTSRSMLSSVSVLLSRVVGADNVTTSEIVRAEIKSIAKVRGTEHGQVAGIRRLGNVLDMSEDALPFSIECMCEALESCQSPREIRSRFILSMGGDTGRRAAEYRAAQMRHVTELDDGTGEFTVPFSKTDQQGEGIIAMLSHRTMRYYHQWRAALAGNGVDIGPNTPLLRSIDAFGRVEGSLWDGGFRLAVRSAVRESLTIIDDGMGVIDVEKIARSVGGHSFRIGMAQDLTAAGESLPAICHAGGWFDTRMPLRYARHLSPRSGAMWRLNKRLGKKKGGEGGEGLNN